MLIRTCEQCSKPFSVPPSWEHKRRFCSMECRKAWTAAQVVYCDECGRAFHVPPTRIRSGVRFCSHACASVAKRVPVEQRFWTKVDKNGPVVRPELGPCWIWMGMREEHGYGRIYVDGVQRLAHRISFELENGPLLEGEQACHQCDNPPCVRPHHLFRGDQRTNNADRDRKGRTQHGHKPASTKLNRASVQRIRTLYAGGQITGPQLAAAFGVGSSTIYAVIHGQSWQET